MQGVTKVLQIPSKAKKEYKIFSVQDLGTPYAGTALSDLIIIVCAARQIRCVILY
jgi:hypothetical protein